MVRVAWFPMVSDGFLRTIIIIIVLLKGWLTGEHSRGPAASQAMERFLAPGAKLRPKAEP